MVVSGLVVQGQLQKKIEARPQFFMFFGASRGSMTTSIALPDKQKTKSKLLFFLSLVRAEVVETSSQVWKTCILTAVLCSQSSGVGYREEDVATLHANRRPSGPISGVGYRDRTDDLLDHNQTL